MKLFVTALLLGLLALMACSSPYNGPETCEYYCNSDTVLKQEMYVDGSTHLICQGGYLNNLTSMRERDLDIECR